jgi:beta-glucosidase
MPNNQNKSLPFPEGFLWGASTSAYQIEGGITNDWSVWENSADRTAALQARNLDPKSYHSGRACDSWLRFEEDFQCLEALHCNSYRMGVEWARIEPKEGEFDQAVIDHYKEMFRALKARKIKLVLTLWHWTNPVWIAENGGWSSRSTVDFFERFVELCIKEFASFTDFWVVLNEPMIHVGNGYLSGKFPPNHKFDLVGAYLTRKNLILAQKVAYERIHERVQDAQVGFTTIANFIEPAHQHNIIELIFAKIYHWWWNLAFLQAVKQSIDYVAFDYYFHDRIVWHPPFRANLNEKTTDMGWEIYPAGIYEVIKYLAVFKKPLYIFENGLADAADQHRADFIRDHLLQVQRAITDGFDVRGYFHWSLLDNFEWAHGFAPKFGLYAVDRGTMKRTARPSAAVYAKICRENGIEV